MEDKLCCVCGEEIDSIDYFHWKLADGEDKFLCHSCTALGIEWAARQAWAQGHTPDL